jgi:phospholipase/carboxylesterase
MSLHLQRASATFARPSLVAPVMPYTAHEQESVVTLEPADAATAAVIWLHGLGADGYDFVPIVEELQLPQQLPTRFVFPHARVRPVTINNGFEMRAWYDIKGFNREGGEDDAGIRESEGVVREYIAQEVARGIPTERIVLAGFSQGGAIALHTGVRLAENLAGVMALSTYLPLSASVAGEATPANRTTSILMCHGTDDNVVPMRLGEVSRDLLTGLGYAIEWRTYPMQHSVCLEEINDISRWLQARLQ